MSLEIILPFLQPIAHLITDPHVSEICTNGDGAVFFQDGRGMVQHPTVLVQPFLVHAIKRIARSLGKDIGEEYPLLDARLPDGSRVAAALPPASIGGAMLTIRKFRPHWFTMRELIENGTILGFVAGQMEAAVRDKKTILVSGGTDTGKTTIAKALIDAIPQSERLGVIEDTAELAITHPNVFRFEAREQQRDASGNQTISAVTTRDLVKASLRHRPDRLIIGEVRGGEAFDMLDALNTGHAGSISTIHANSATGALSRLASLALRAGVEVPYRAIQADIGDLIQYVVQLSRRDGKRVVSEVIQVDGFDGEKYKTRSILEEENI